MSTVQSAEGILDRQYLEMRCGLLDLAAALDRVEKATNAVIALNDPRWNKLQEGLKIVASNGTNRAERIQLLFSDEYIAGWNRKK